MEFQMDGFWGGYGIFINFSSLKQHIALIFGPHTLEICGSIRFQTYGNTTKRKNLEHDKIQKLMIFYKFSNQEFLLVKKGRTNHGAEVVRLTLFQK